MAGSTHEATPRKQRNARQAATRRNAIRFRLSSRAVREKNDGTEGSAARIPPSHAKKIAEYHALEKKLATSTGKERENLLEKQHALGGLESYQQASVRGARHGESGKWLVKELEQRHGRRDTDLLDVGAISGTAYKKYKSIHPTYIDLNPQAAHVVRADFMDYPVPKKLFDVVALSLVLNFVGDLGKRADMLRRVHDFLKPDGYLYIVLPLACLQNSRYLDSERFTGLLSTLGWTVEAQSDSALLTHWLLRKGKHDSTPWPRKEIRSGVKRNNFVIIVK